MAMPSALHQEPRPACSLISLFTCIVLSTRLLNQPPILLLLSVLNQISQHFSFFIFITALYLQPFVCYPLSHLCPNPLDLFSPYTYIPSLCTESFILFALLAFSNHSYFYLSISGSSLVLWPLSIFITKLKSPFPSPSHLNNLAYFLSPSSEVTFLYNFNIKYTSWKR